MQEQIIEKIVQKVNTEKMQKKSVNEMEKWQEQITRKNNTMKIIQKNYTNNYRK